MSHRRILDGMSIAEDWPVFSAELEQALRTCGEHRLADTVSSLTVRSRCACADSFCQTFHVGTSTAPLVTLALPAPWAGNLLVDVADGDIQTVEVLFRDPLN